MHFVTGGYFNGKRNWVKENYTADQWISAYNNAALIEDDSLFSGSTVVLEGLEQWTKNLSEKMVLDEARVYLSLIFDRWLQWEKEDACRRLIIIGTDISKGIVPMEKADRNWRDLTGWVYQDLVTRCSRVDIIWYGLPQTIKGGDNK